MNRSCGTCKSNIGGGCCRINSELECGDDDARPLWEVRTVFRGYAEAGDYRDLLQPEGYKAHTEGDKVVAEWT